MYYLTEHANDLLEFEYPDSMNVISIYETLGQEEYIWELWIYYEENGKRIIDKWHWEEWEEWYCGSSLGYEFSNSYTPEQLRAHPDYSTFICPFLFKE